MMEWTDRHCRYFHRQLSRHARLYTEMLTTGTLLHGDAARHLAYAAEWHPLGTVSGIAAGSCTVARRAVLRRSVA